MPLWALQAPPRLSNHSLQTPWGTRAAFTYQGAKSRSNASIRSTDITYQLANHLWSNALAIEGGDSAGLSFVGAR